MGKPPHNHHSYFDILHRHSKFWKNNCLDFLISRIAMPLSGYRVQDTFVPELFYHSLRLCYSLFFFQASLWWVLHSYKTAQLCQLFLGINIFVYLVDNIPCSFKSFFFVACLAKFHLNSLDQNWYFLGTSFHKLETFLLYNNFSFIRSFVLFYTGRFVIRNFTQNQFHFLSYGSF